MSTSETKPKPKAVFSEEESDDRPFILPYVEKPAFTAWDKVFLLDASGAKQGQYYIASVVSPQMYTLCLEDGTDFRGGSEIGKELLIPA